MTSLCGERGIRTPGTSQFNGFQDRRDRPLRHLSSVNWRLSYRFNGCKVRHFSNTHQIFCKKNFTLFRPQLHNNLIFNKITTKTFFNIFLSPITKIASLAIFAQNYPIFSIRRFFVILLSVNKSFLRWLGNLLSPAMDICAWAM